MKEQSSTLETTNPKIVLPNKDLVGIKKSETKKNQDVKETGKITYIKKDIKDKKVVVEKENKGIGEEVSKTKNEESDTDEKTGWWS